MTQTSDIFFPTDEIEKTFLNCIWRITDFDSNKRKEIILPKGTVEIIFNFSDNISYFNPSSQVKKKLPLVFMNGINLKPFELYKTGRQAFLGIQLNGIGLRLLFNISAHEAKNNIYDGKNVCVHLHSLAEQLYAEQSFSQQVAMILTWIRKKMPLSNHQFPIQRVQKLLHLNFAHDLTVKKMSHEICLSDRQLRRFSHEWLGMNTEAFMLYQKYLRCLHSLHHANQTLTTIGLEAGYYDQSHFIREFKSFTNLTPKQYKEANTGLPGHIFV
jgi:AraC-like DNA-binding protein